ncbi:hypothetical protein NQ318_012432 [Aromia moschata]|uniref:Uncharacterized protein n=1 Tax=Aromia moschata TaxID=1265417 RepID=A0AAV8X618_9CUCU|nr:hypothetical protein NQ318_012432 [Aromia moschata]
MAHLKYGRTEKSFVAQHAFDNNHRIDINNLKLIRNVTNNRQLDAFESLEIIKCNNIMNKDNGPIPTSPLFALINKYSYGSVNRGNKFGINSANANLVGETRVEKSVVVRCFVENVQFFVSTPKVPVPTPGLYTSHSQRLKNNLKGRDFGTIENIQTAVTDHLKAIPVNEFQPYYEEWKNRIQRCVASQEIRICVSESWNGKDKCLHGINRRIVLKREARPSSRTTQVKGNYKRAKDSRDFPY